MFIEKHNRENDDEWLVHTTQKLYFIYIGNLGKKNIPHLLNVKSCRNNFPSTPLE